MRSISKASIMIHPVVLFDQSRIILIAELYQR
jgi:hypothetical protein